MKSLVHAIESKTLLVRSSEETIHAINNLAHNEHSNAYIKLNKIFKLSDQYKLQVSNYIIQLLQSNIKERVESSLLINNQIHSHNTRSNNQMSILCVNRSKTKYCVLHNGKITWNSLPAVFNVNFNVNCCRIILTASSLGRLLIYRSLVIHLLVLPPFRLGRVR